jgi:hypothetical protein
MFGIDDAINIGLKIIDRVIPDPTAKAEAQQKLLELQQNGELKLEEFNVKKEEIAAGDRDSARKMEIANENLRPTDLRVLMPNILALLIVISYFVLQWFILNHPFPPENHDSIMRMLGVTDSALTLVLGFYFGSSSSSRSKDDVIQKLSK